MGTNLVAAVAVLVTLATGEVRPPRAIIAWDSMQPCSPGPGVIHASGTFEIDAAKYEFIRIDLYALHPGGGEGGEAPATTYSADGRWQADINGLEAVEFSVFARIIVKDLKTGGRRQFDTRTKSATPKAPPP